MERTYQVEIVTVLWSLPAKLVHLPAYGENAGWLEVSGPRGPWLVERIIVMEEFIGDMNCDGKVSILDSCLRRAFIDEGGEVDIKLHQHVREEMRA